MSYREPFVEVHGVGDGVEPLQGDDRQCEDGQLARQDTKEPRNQTTWRRLPLDSVLLKLTCNKSKKINRKNSKRLNLKVSN